MKEKLFSKEQECFILDNYSSMTNKELADLFGVKSSQVNSWLYHHGIKRNGVACQYNNIFSNDDVQFIINNYQKMTAREIGNILGYTNHQIQGKIAKLNLPKKKREINDSYFDHIDSPLKAYFLGFIYADGWVINNEKYGNYEFGMMLQSCDKYILDKLDQELGGGNLITYRCPRDEKIGDKIIHSSDSYSLRVFSKNIVRGLMLNGIETNKSNKDSYPIVPDNLFFDYLRGYIDGDGCYYSCKNVTYMHITCASIEPLKYIHNKLIEYNIVTRIYTENQKKHRLMCVNTKEMNKLINRLYYENGLFCLERKFEKIKHFVGFAA